MSASRLGGQVAVVTGGGRGLGAVLAERLAREGSAVALAGRNLDALIATATHLEELEADVLPVQADISDPQSVNRMVERVEDELGPVDLLVNNAGITFHGRFWESPLEAWWRVIEVNLRGPALCSHAVMREMVPRGRGRVVNIVSGAANRPSTDGQTAYAVSKAGLVRLTDCLATETLDAGIRVFGLSPGLVKTDMGVEAEEHRGTIGSADWTPMSLAADLLVAMADGTLDRLTGRVVHSRDDLGEMLRQAARIRELDLYQLRERTLDR